MKNKITSYIINNVTTIYYFIPNICSGKGVLMIVQNNSFMVNADLITLQEDKTVEKIAYKLLINLFSKGNNNAYDIAINRNNGLVTIEDLTQTMYLFLLENSNNWYLYRSSHRYSTDEFTTKLVFFDDNTQREFFRIVSNEVYNNIRKHDRKKLWIEVDNELVKIDDIPSLASHTCIDDVMTLSLYNQFTSYLLSVKPKQAERLINAIDLRLQGYKYSEIALSLGIKETSVKKDFQTLKELWKEFNK